jgi:predicted O-methyltransferase YrrM
MLTRINDFYTFLTINEQDRARGKQQAARAAETAGDMTHIKDYEALAAIALHVKPRRIFEIGTYLGVTSDFLLSLIPDCRVVSIAFENSLWNLSRKRFNNSELPHERIGSKVNPARRARFTQLYGDSHKLDSEALIATHGRFDLVFIDGDHSRAGVSQDTALAKAILTSTGVICWHDANPKPRYMDVREYLEVELPLSAIATCDDYIGGVACWSKQIEDRLSVAGAERT